MHFRFRYRLLWNARAISLWNFGLVGRLGLGVGVKTSGVMLRSGEIGA